jgi:hypothetical protein
MRLVTSLIITAGLAVVGVGCNNQHGDSAHDGAAPALTAPAAAPEPGRYEEAQSIGRGAGGTTGAAAVSAVPPVAGTDVQAGRPLSSSSMIIRNGTASVEVDSLEPGVEAIRRLVTRVGGYVGNTALQAGEESVRSATLELRVPADRFDEVVAGLAPVGAIDYVNVTAEDVGEQYVDLTARADNARRLEARLVELLAQRAGKLADVLAVERELARVREEIERIDGRMRYLRTRAEMSSLTVTLHEPGPLVGRPGDHPIADALRQAWRNAVMFFAWLIAASGVLIPLAVLAGVGVSLWRRFMPRRRPAPEPAA